LHAYRGCSPQSSGTNLKFFSHIGAGVDDSLGGHHGHGKSVDEQCELGVPRIVETLELHEKQA
jgi:hypothetical protein